MAEEELRSLIHLYSRQVIYSQQQTFIVGYIANMKASIALAKELFSEGTSFSYLLLCRLSQDARYVNCNQVIPYKLCCILIG